MIKVLELDNRRESRASDSRREFLVIHIHPVIVQVILQFLVGSCCVGILVWE
jgi:hypothetical protein